MFESMHKHLPSHVFLPFYTLCMEKLKRFPFFDRNYFHLLYGHKFLIQYNCTNINFSNRRKITSVVGDRISVQTFKGHLDFFVQLKANILHT